MTWEPDDWTVNADKLFDLSGRTAVVTGGASGLGRAIALGLGARGATVAIGDIDPDGAAEVSDAIDGEAIAVEADVTDVDSLERLRDRTVDAFGGFDIVFNVPGVNHRKPVLDLSPTEWHEVIEVNLTGMFNGAQMLGGHLVESGGGSMVNMASTLGLQGLSRQGAYASSKGGVVQLTKVLASEWAPAVRVNALAPGYIKTPLVVQVMEDREWYEEMRDRHLMKRFGEPEEVVGAAVFLASEASSFVTGSVLTVDGGWTAH